MNIDKYLYEIIDDYKNAKTIEEKNDIFNLFCSSIWSNKNKRRIYTKTIKFKVRDDLLKSENGRIFNTWSEIEYVGYKATTQDTDWCSLIRQKVNNLYTRYFDDTVILKKDYMDMLKTPKRLYYRWINGEEVQCKELINIIDDAMDNAKALKTIYQKQKMKLSWEEYKKIIEDLLKKIFNNCKPIEDYENEMKLVSIYNLSSEDNSYISYFCKSLEGYILNYQKDYYNVKRGHNQKYKRCKECGKLIENTGNKKMFCDICADKHRKQSNKISDKKYKMKQRENRKLII